MFVAGIDILDNNAGEGQHGPLEGLPIESVDEPSRLNVFGPVRLSQLLLPDMRPRHDGGVLMVGPVRRLAHDGRTRLDQHRYRRAMHDLPGPRVAVCR